MGSWRPSVEIITPALPERFKLLWECHARIARQTYRMDFNATVLHTIVWNGPEPPSTPTFKLCRELWLKGPANDHGSAAINFGMQHVLCDLAMQVADDEWLEDTAVQHLVEALLDQSADFALAWREFPGGRVQQGGTPAVATNLSTGLFWPKWWQVADMISGPSGLYSQPGADGAQAFDWLQRGATLAIVPTVLSKTVRQPGLQ